MAAVTDRGKRLAVPGMRRIAVPSAHEDALSHGIALVAGPVVFGLLGAWVDHLAGTGWIFAAAFAVIGVVGSVASLYYRYEERMAKLDEGKPWTRRKATP